MANIENLNIDTIKGEIWEQVKEFPKYLVSNYGRIYSFYRDKVIKPYPVGDSRLYLGVVLSKDKMRACERLHRVVADAFIPNPKDKQYVHHIDGNSFNNHADNLMWVTLEEHFAIHAQMKPAKKNQ